MVAHVTHRRYLIGRANAALRERCALTRNDGAGWTALAEVACSVRHSDQQPAPADPAEATAGTAETVVVMVPLGTPSRTGDRVSLLAFPTRAWTVGAGNWTESRATFLALRAARPTAATARVALTLFRFSEFSSQRTALPPQLAHVILLNRQPQASGQAMVAVEGMLFAPEGLPDLDVFAGDVFYRNGREHVVTWVNEDAPRREASFTMQVGEAWAGA